MDSSNLFCHTPLNPIESNVSVVRKQLAHKRWYEVKKDCGSTERYPSITTILSNTGDKGFLERWRKNIGHAKAAKITKDAAIRGEAMHDLIEAYLKNEELPKTNSIIGKRLFNQVRRLLKKNVSDIVLQEEYLYNSTLKMAGAVDCVAKYNGKLAIIDFKSSTKLKKEEYVFDYFLQATAYSLMFLEMYDVLIEDIVILVSVEQSILPQVFEAKIYDFIPALQERVETYHAQGNQS